MNLFEHEDEMAVATMPSGGVVVLRPDYVVVTPFGHATWSIPKRSDHPAEHVDCAPVIFVIELCCAGGEVATGRDLFSAIWPSKEMRARNANVGRRGRGAKTMRQKKCFSKSFNAMVK